MKGGADVVFLDPPYELDCYEECLSAMAAAGFVESGGVVVCEHGAARALPEHVSEFVKIKEKKYGATGVTVFSYQVNV
jgi:16S rRNA G966 N2-methylase RsmD